MFGRGEEGADPASVGWVGGQMEAYTGKPGFSDSKLCVLLVPHATHGLSKHV